MTKADFLARLKVWKRDENIFNAIFFPAFFGTLYGAYLVGVWMDEHKPALWIQISFGAVIVGFLVGATVVALKGDKYRACKHRLTCPVCQTPLVNAVAQHALATETCHRCGARLFQSDLYAKIRSL